MENKAVVTLLAALAQESRLAIFRLLIVQGPQGMTVGKIGEALDIPPATLSFHLKELTRASLIDARQEGRFIHYSANYQTMGSLLSFMTENCCTAAGAASDETSCCS
ncbi:helix-turn-helix transcriptional regulator [Chitinimonas arctica]|uniref:Helix-turn-helix transcriptional regulator n=1 Tax=Chitinimonas arctica TaxID=2594795 RepID=A0A516SD79_9NEIS|nr:metalloregulator ArsR/SmtB family transcription factor [Chitinimonas arctica]QDQ26090.1 helix-turn-helix transcriptional regulator [Chitinimonas arctica]